MTCTQWGCEGKVHARGLCNKHHKRLLRHGSANVVLVAPRGSLKAWVKKHVAFSGDDCLLWPFSISVCGYPIRRNGKKYIRVNREMCELAHGAPPSEGLHAAHSCGNALCLNPAHLRWATPAENNDDKFAHETVLYGESHPSSKLTEADVREIRRRVCGGEARNAVARVYGVASSTVDRITNGETWSRTVDEVPA